MNKAKLIILSLFLSCLLIIVSFETAPCFTLLDGKLEVNGFLENWSGIRLEDGLSGLHGFQTNPPVHLDPENVKGLEAGDLYLFRNTIQVELNYELTRELVLFGIYRGWYEGSLDFDTDMEKLIASGKRDEYRKDSDIREIYVDFVPGNWHFRLGKQQVVWGESQGFQMADIIHPLDWTYQFIHPDWEDIRVPLWMADIRYAFPCNIGPFSNTSAEVVFLPNTFDGGMQPTNLAPHGAHWSAPTFVQPFLDWIDSGTPEESLRNAEYGMRLRGLVNGWDLTTFCFYTWADLPVVNFDKLLDALGGADVNPMEYKRVFQAGGTFNYYEGRTQAVFRGECVYRHNEPYNSIDLTKLYRLDTFAYMVGVDRPTWFKPLNKVHPFFISAQVFQKYIGGFNDRMNTADTSQDDMQTLITLFINNSYTWYFLPGGTDNITPSFFGMYDPSGEGWVRLQMNIRFGDYWRGAIGTNMYWATDNAQAFFGLMQDNSNAYVNLRFEW
jgi:hypothetical protein